jgi:SAM-dependent methyltransferase
MPGFDRFVELRWRAMIRRARVYTPEEHAAAFADPGRRGAAIEIPMECDTCGGRRLQEMLHVFDHRRAKYTAKRIRRYEVTMGAFGPLFASGDGRRLLDFGCGNGLFLDLAHERGFDCYGVDLAEDAIEVARSKPSGQHAYHGAPMEIPEIARGGFDVITMWSVLAHLAEPLKDLTMLLELLRPEGVLLVLTVNSDSLVFRRHLKTWGGFTPNHLLFSSPRTLPLLLGRAGFGAVAMPPWYGEAVETGQTPIGPGAQRRLRRTVDRGNRGNMLRAAAFVDPDGPSQWGLERHARRLAAHPAARRGAAVAP